MAVKSICEKVLKTQRNIKRVVTHVGRVGRWSNQVHTDHSGNPGNLSYSFLDQWSSHMTRRDSLDLNTDRLDRQIHTESDKHNSTNIDQYTLLNDWETKSNHKSVQHSESGV